MLQRIKPQWSAWLVDTGAVRWDTLFSDPARAEWQARKMKSKDSRPAAQMAALGIEPGLVGHIKLTEL